MGVVNSPALLKGVHRPPSTVETLSVCKGKEPTSTSVCVLVTHKREQPAGCSMHDVVRLSTLLFDHADRGSLINHHALSGKFRGAINENNDMP